MQTKIIILLISHALAFCLGAFLVQPKTVETVVVKEIEKPVVRYVKEVKKDDCAELFKAYRSPIVLTHSERGAVIAVKGSDGYKETTAQWEIQTTPDYRVYFGVGGVCALGGAVLMYKVLK